MCPRMKFSANRFALAFLLVLAFVALGAGGARADNIFEAIQRDDANALARYVNADKSLLETHFGKWQDTPLHLAARLGRVRLARLLLAGGADVNRERFANEIALSDAIMENHPDMVKLLLQAGANVNHQDSTGWTPLMWAADRDLGEMTTLLLDARANINAHRTGVDSYTALHIAVQGTHLAAMGVLIKRHADLNAGAKDSGTPLHLAAYLGGKWYETRWLAAAGANLEARNDQGDTPLHVAARGGVGVLHELLSVGANIRARNKLGLTPREEAQRVGRADCADIIRFYEEALREYDLLEAERNSPRYQVHAGYANWKTPGLETREVYRSRFDEAIIDAPWQAAPRMPRTLPLFIAKTPTGGQRFLGDFVNKEVRLSLNSLPPHQEISVSFDLYVLRTWDGNNAQYGPDIWALAVTDGPTLIRTTFANTDIISLPGLKIQAYPGNFPADFYPLRAGASEANTLGYTFINDGKPVPCDAVYRLRYTFRHADAKLQLRFSGDLNSQGPDDESWGLASVRVAVGATASSPELVKHTPAISRPAAVQPHAVVHPSVIVSRATPARKPKAVSTRAVSKPKVSAKASQPAPARPQKAANAVKTRLFITYMARWAETPSLQSVKEKL